MPATATPTTILRNPSEYMRYPPESWNLERCFAVRDQLRHEPVDLVHGNGEADTSRRAGRTDDRRVDADEPAGAVEQRAARVSRVDRSTGLDDAADRPAARRLDLPIQGADDAGRQ